MMKKLRQPPVHIWGEPTREHDRILRLLWYNPWLFEDALKLKNIHMLGMEVQYDPFITDERCDMVFQDKFDAYRLIENTTCYVLELKSKEADHEVLGQLKKAVQTYQKIGNSYKCWNRVIGIAVAKEFTASGMDLIQQEGYLACLWKEQDDKACLNLQEPVIRRPVLSNISEHALQSIKDSISLRHRVDWSKQFNLGFDSFIE